MLATLRSNPRGQRWAIAVVEILGLCVWFVASAILPALRDTFDLSAGSAAFLIAMVQIGYVVGAILSAVLNLADRIPAHWLLTTGAATAALATLLMPFTGSVPVAFGLRFLTGFALAAVYPVGMFLMASWSAREERGRAFGLLLAALTLGSALPHLIRSYGGLSWEVVVWVSAGCAAVAATISAVIIRRGPEDRTPRTPLKPAAAVAMFRNREIRWVNFGYFGHMWELYAWWAWVPMFLIAARDRTDLTGLDSLTVFFLIGVAGAGGCLAAGRVADRFGRPRAAGFALLVSGTCCVLSPLIFVAPHVLALTLLFIWGASVVADSGVFSAALSEVAPSELVGTALAIQTALGLLLTNVTMIAVPWVGNQWGWQFAFVVLVPGPIVGGVAMFMLHKVQRREFAAGTEPLLIGRM